jgi:hypothetical protein
VPQDRNGQWDVYQYEPAKIGFCTEEGETFEMKPNGCVNLISSGQSNQESAFLGASESGGDVFILTAASLSSQDTDEQLDVYDAHECSLSPCIAPPTASTTAACTTGETCRPGSFTKQLLGAPATTTLSGLGNITPAKPRPMTRAQKLAKALRACHKYRRRVKRSACERQARKKYGSRKAKKSRAEKRRGRRRARS